MMCYLPMLVTNGNQVVPGWFFNAWLTGDRTVYLRSKFGIVRMARRFSWPKMLFKLSGYPKLNAACARSMAQAAFAYGGVAVTVTVAGVALAVSVRLGVAVTPPTVIFSQRSPV